MISITILSCSLGFWVSNTAALLDFAYRFRDFARYPVTIFNSFFKFILTFVIPIGFIAFYPSKVFLRQGEFDILMYFSPIAGVLLFIAACKVWSRGVNCYLGTGS
jgi:ABC-2 type transport system permease protein